METESDNTPGVEPEQGRYAVASEGETVAPHLGTSITFAVYERSAGKAVWQEELQNMMLAPGFILLFLLKHRIDTVIVGNSGGGLCALLEKNGIRVVRGVEGSVRTAAEAYAAGTLVGKEIPCTQHDQCSGCGACH